MTQRLADDCSSLKFWFLRFSKLANRKPFYPNPFWIIKSNELSNLLHFRNYWLNSELMLNFQDQTVRFVGRRQLTGVFRIERMRCKKHLSLSSDDYRHIHGYIPCVNLISPDKLLEIFAKLRQRQV